MILRLGLLFLLTLLLAASAAAQSPILPVEIYIDELPRPLSLAPADADAFQRRLNAPPLLEPRPVTGGVSIGVDTRYWDAALREAVDDPQVGVGGRYYPDGGFVELSRDGRAAWIVLDLRQRALLDRYVRFAVESGGLLSTPSSLEVIIFAAQTETIGIEAGDRSLSEAEAQAFWAATFRGDTKAIFRDPPRPPDATRPGYWLTFALPEGSTRQFFVDVAAGELTDALGTENHDVRGLIGTILPESATFLTIEHEDPAGSAIWWLIAVAAGGGLLVLALALQRGIERGKRKTRSL